MCGIAGKLFFDGQKNVDPYELKRMTDSILHRGPDDEGHYIDNNVGLGFRRLSIIDVSHGHQPLSNYNQTIWITFNGEIYNFKELRSELIARNYVFRTNSDTEVIVNLYEEFGEQCVDHLRGIFAFVIWDQRNKKLFGARDHIGVKPFYYYVDESQFVWGSEIKAIKAAEEVSTRISIKSLDQYLAYGHMLKNESIYQEIHKLQPGTSFTIEPLKSPEVRFYQFWTMENKPDDSKSHSEFKDELRCELEQSVKLQMISDVPIGAFLSGGVDSSSIVAMMSKISERPIKTFSIGFKEPEFDETKYAQMVAKKYGTEHHEMIVEPESIDLLPVLVNLFDEPFADSSAVPMYYLSKFSREHVTVALSGDGGDELFAGYSRYQNMLRLHNRPFNNKFFNEAASFVHKLTPDYLELKKWSYYFGIDSNNIGAVMGIFKPYERRRLYKDWVIGELGDYESEADKVHLSASFSGDFISRMQQLDLSTYLVDDVLTKVDRTSMANSLEVRVPILDHKVVEFSSTIPSSMKINKMDQKIIFKDAMEDALPQEIITHKKQGFSVPMSMWFRESLKDYLSDTLLSSDAKINDYFCKDAVREIVSNHNKGFRDYSSKIWALLFLEEWLQKN
ncbi:asparagine synthase (glutamine-hydrolyzing) [bacterium]|nr:asparagine synthase (glutamine-hydrolyzing) [bacterium]